MYDPLLILAPEVYIKAVFPAYSKLDLPIYLFVYLFIYLLILSLKLFCVFQGL